MEKAREYHRPLYICFVDLRKAYDSINRAAHWCLLQYCYHLPSTLLKIIEALHSNTSAAVKPGPQYDAGTSVVRASWPLTMSEHQRHTVKHVGVFDARTTLGERPRRWNKEKF